MKTELAKKIANQERRPSMPGEILADLLECAQPAASNRARFALSMTFSSLAYPVVIDQSLA